MDWFNRYQELISTLIATLDIPETQRPDLLKSLTYIFPVLLFFILLWFVALLLKHKAKKKMPPEEVAQGDLPSVADIETDSAVAEELLSAETPEDKAEAVALPVSLVERMRTGLAKTQATFVGRLDDLIGKDRGIDDRLWEDLEEVLITADVGMKTTLELREALEKRHRDGRIVDAVDLRTAIKEEIRLRLDLKTQALDFEANGPFVLIVIGVNGVGKTTTIGKLAHFLVRQQGKKVILGACDTFRAAAVEQLGIWAERAGAGLVSHREGADPAGVAFDTVRAALSRQADVVILDTAGRLHTKVNLMEEVKKIRRVVGREIAGAPHETLLVLDATLGQNSLIQARLFQEAVDVSGLILTKLDGTARGGMIVAISNELQLPVRFVGIGEKTEDLRPFAPDIFVDALFKIA